MSTPPTIDVGLFIPDDAIPTAAPVIGKHPSFRLDLDSNADGVSLYLPRRAAGAVAYLDHLAMAIATLRADVVEFSRTTACKPVESHR